MDKCFLFTKHLDDQGCFCLKLSEDGALISPPAQRSFSEIKELQKESSTVIVETAASAILLDLELHWLPERKARLAIPYALEDKLAQPIDELHFAFDKTRYQNNHYLITVIGKQRMKQLMQVCAIQDIKFEAITLDWFAITKEFIVTESSLLINNDDFKGLLSGSLALSYIKNHPLNEVLLFKDSQIIPEGNPTINNEYSYTWIAQKLLNSKPLNLCQGDMQHGNASDWIKKGYLMVGGLSLLWLVSLILVNAISVLSLNKQLANLDQQISVIYHEFFPDAKQVISPKFRIGQLLGTNAEAKQSHFWFLLNQLAKGMEEVEITMERLRYQGKVLSVTLVSSDFAKLEELENNLKKLQLNVKQTQASNREQKVVATLELS
jgi:general secretion pathway protein L